MALRLRLRRALSLSYPLHHSIHQSNPISSHLLSTPISTTSPAAAFIPSSNQLTRPFTTTSTLFRKVFDPETDEIGPDTILFEGCDYNHWLITIDFPKDSNITREQMIETYVDTAAQVFGSVEEAKKKIYALSTTTYQGFQVECSEETSEKFKSLPGVVFVLPDSYIDPANKEYGGDKYVNGEIFPRPPPVHYGRRDNSDRRRRDNYGPPNQQNYGRGQQQNYGPPQPQNNVSPPRQDFGEPTRQNFGPSPPRQDFATSPPRQDFSLPPSRQGFAPPPQQDFAPPPPGQGFAPPPPRQDFAPPPPGQGFAPPPPRQGFAPPPRQDFAAPPRQDYGPPPRQEYGPPPQQNYGPAPQQSNGPQQNYRSPPRQNYGLPPQQNYGLPPQQNYRPPPQQNYGNHPNSPPQQNYVPQGSGDRGSFTPLSNAYQGNLDSGNHYPEGQRDFQQGSSQSPMPPEQSGFSPDSGYGSPRGAVPEQALGARRDFSSIGNNN